MDAKLSCILDILHKAVPLHGILKGEAHITLLFLQMVYDGV